MSIWIYYIIKFRNCLKFNLFSIFFKSFHNKQSKSSIQSNIPTPEFPFLFSSLLFILFLSDYVPLVGSLSSILIAMKTRRAFTSFFKCPKNNWTVTRVRFSFAGHNHAPLLRMVPCSLLRVVGQTPLTLSGSENHHLRRKLNIFQFRLDNLVDSDPLTWTH